MFRGKKKSLCRSLSQRPPPSVPRKLRSSADDSYLDEFNFIDRLPDFALDPLTNLPNIKSDSLWPSNNRLGNNSACLASRYPDRFQQCSAAKIAPTTEWGQWGLKIPNSYEASSMPNFYSGTDPFMTNDLPIFTYPSGFNF